MAGWRGRQGRGELIWNRGSKLIGCEVQGTLSRALRRRAEQDRERRNLRPDLPPLPLLPPLLLSPSLLLLLLLLLPLLLLLLTPPPPHRSPPGSRRAVSLAVPDQCRGFVYCFVHEIPYLLNTSIRRIEPTRGMVYDGVIDDDPCRRESPIAIRKRKLELARGTHLSYDCLGRLDEARLIKL